MKTNGRFRKVTITAPTADGKRLPVYQAVALTCMSMAQLQTCVVAPYRVRRWTRADGPLPIKWI